MYCSLLILFGAVTRIFLVLMYVSVENCWKLDRYAAFDLGSLDGTKSTLKGGSEVTQFPVQFFHCLQVSC